MKNKLIFRILGALSSALIIVSVFVPFVKVTGYSQSLWQTNINTLYLPIIIIVFGAIGVLLFATNLKTELAYSTAGALLFFLITQSIPIINQGTFSTLNIGYYFLVAGTLLTGIMTFLCGLKSKQNIVVDEVKVEEETKEDSMINQIDRLYENQTVQTNESEINQVEMIQPLQPLQPLTENNNSLNMQMQENETQKLNDSVQSTIQTNIQEEPKPQNSPIVEENFEQLAITEEPKVEISDAFNPVVSGFEVSKQEEQTQAFNPVVSEFQAQIPEESIPPMNPVVSEFATADFNEINNLQMEPSISNSISQENNTASFDVANPVVSEFEVPSQFNIGVTESPLENEEEKTQIIEPIQPLKPLGDNFEKVDVMADPSTMKDNNSSNLDIFG